MVLRSEYGPGSDNPKPVQAAPKMRKRDISATKPYKFDERQALDEKVVRLRRIPHLEYIHWMMVLKALGATDEAWGTSLN